MTYVSVNCECEMLSIWRGRPAQRGVFADDTSLFHTHHPTYPTPNLVHNGSLQEGNPPNDCTPCLSACLPTCLSATVTLAARKLHFHKHASHIRLRVVFFLTLVLDSREISVSSTSNNNGNTQQRTSSRKHNCTASPDCGMPINPGRKGGGGTRLLHSLFMR